MPTQVSAQLAAALAPHIRIQDHAIALLVEEGKALSPTFSAIVDRLEQSTVVVYVLRERCRYSRMRGCVLHKVAVGGEARMLWMGIEPTGLGRADAIALLAHELRHVLEVADAPWVQSDDDIRKFFWNARGAEGKADGERGSVETSAAIEVEFRVRREVRTALALKARK